MFHAVLGVVGVLPMDMYRRERLFRFISRIASVGERSAENLLERKWRLPHGCSESRPRQAEIRIADEIMTILPEAALENEQIDKAMVAMGIPHNLKNEDNVVVARGGGSKSVQMGLAQAARQGILAGDSMAKGRHLVRETRIAAAWNSWYPRRGNDGGSEGVQASPNFARLGRPHTSRIVVTVEGVISYKWKKWEGEWDQRDPPFAPLEEVMTMQDGFQRRG